MRNRILAVDEILNENLYATLATSSKRGEPWISNIFFCNGENYEFFWYSPKEALHSRYINENPKIAICIYNSTAVGNQVSAVYIKARATELKKINEVAKAMIPYGQKMLNSKFISTHQDYSIFLKGGKDFFGKSPLRMYKAVPEEIWLLGRSRDFKGKFVDTRVKVKFPSIS